MRSWLTWVITALVAILFGALPPAPVLATVSEDTTYTYDFQDLSAATPRSTTGRGPPATYNNAITYDPNGLRTLGVSARSHTPTTPATCDYDDLARNVRTARVSHGAEGQPRGLDEGLCVLLSVRSAANAGDDLIRLSTKDSWANLKTLDDHFARHGADFGATSADDYARMGSEFFQRGGAQHLPTKITPDGTIRMYDPATNTFGSFAPNGMTKTLFKPTSPDYWSRQPGVLQ